MYYSSILPKKSSKSFASLKFLYTEANLTYATLSKFNRASIINSPIKLDIYDASGKQWGITEFIHEKTYNISLEGLAEGIYFLFLENKNFKNIYKIHKIK